MDILVTKNSISRVHVIICSDWLLKGSIFFNDSWNYFSGWTTKGDFLKVKKIDIVFHPITVHHLMVEFWTENFNSGCEKYLLKFRVPDQLKEWPWNEFTRLLWLNWWTCFLNCLDFLTFIVGFKITSISCYIGAIQ